MEDYPYGEDDFSERPEPERPRDPAIDRAKQAIMEVVGQRRREVFYGRQVQILLEREFFHWIADFALTELIEEGELDSEKVELERGSNVRVKFVFDPAHRFRRRQIKEAVGVIREFSKPEVARACGVQAEILFKLAFLKRGFMLRGEDVREYGGRVWAATGHNIDFIVEKDGAVYGAEVKNRLDYIEPEELAVKLQLCQHIGVRPVFIMRAAAKSYNHRVIQEGGFALIFQSQIYPPGQEQLVERMRRVLGLPAVCSAAIPDGIVDRFVRWHEGMTGIGAR